MKDLQILVDKCVVKEAEDALAAVHDIPENDDRFDVVRLRINGSSSIRRRHGSRFHEMARTSSTQRRRGCRDDRAAWHAAPADSGNASSLLSSRESQLGFVHWIDATQQLKKRKSGCLNLFGRGIRCQAHTHA